MIGSFLDTLKDKHIGTLVITILTTMLLFLYAVYVGVQSLYEYEPWSVAFTFLCIAAGICLIHIIPIIVKRVKASALNTALTDMRVRTPFALDQSRSNSEIDLLCRLQAYTRRTNKVLIFLSALTLALITGAVVTYNYSEDAQVAIFVQKKDAQAVMRVQKKDAILAQQIEAEKIQAITQEIETAVFNEIELRRTALLINIKNTMINLLTTELDPSDRLSKELKTCKKSPNRCFRVESQGLSYLLDDYTTQQNRYKNALNAIMAHKLDELLKQSIHSVTSEHESTIATLQQTWIQKADQDFFEFYNTINQIPSKTKYIKAIDSAKIKDTKTREVIAQMFYLELLEKAIQSQPEFSTSHTTHTHLIVFTSQFEADAKRKYKEEDFDGPKAVRVRQEEEPQDDPKNAMLKDLEARRVHMQETIANNLINNLSTNFDKTELIAQHIKTCKEKPNQCFRLSEQGESHINSNYTVLESEYTKQLYLLRLYNFDTLIQADNNIPDNLRPTLRYTWLQDVDQFFYTLYQSKEFQKSFKTSEPIKYLNSAHIKDKNLREVIAQILFLDSLTKEIKAYIAPQQKANPAQNIFPKTPYESVFKRELDSKYKKEDFDGSKAVRISVL